MKKILIIIILLIMNITIYINKNKIYPVDLELEDKGLIITLLSLQNSKSIVINNKDLLLLEYINDLDINSSLKLYGINTINNFILTNNHNLNIKSKKQSFLKEKLYIDNYSIYKKENIISINYDNYTFCIYKTGNIKNLNNCNFIYFLNLDDVYFTDEVLAVFFDTNIEKERIEKYYDKWVDSYILKQKSFNTLKICGNNYEVIEVPHK